MTESSAQLMLWGNCQERIFRIFICPLPWWLAFSLLLTYAAEWCHWYDVMLPGCISTKTKKKTKLYLCIQITIFITFLMKVKLKTHPHLLIIILLLFSFKLKVSFISFLFTFIYFLMCKMNAKSKWYLGSVRSQQLIFCFCWTAKMGFFTRVMIRSYC